jgi:hypothetical protein
MAAGTLLLYVTLATAGAWVLVMAGRRAWGAWRVYAAPRIVTCPETAAPAAVRVDALKVAFAALLDLDPALTLRNCSRWNERGPCDQPCLPQVVSGEAAAVPDLLAHWYAGKRCVYCAADITHGPRGITRAALRSPEGITVEWRAVAPERLPGLLATHQPVCWNCHVAETFRRLYPDLVVDRPAH